MANSYLNKTPSSASNRKTFTFSCWFKKSTAGSGQYGRLFSCYSDNNNRDEIYFHPTNDTINIEGVVSSTAIVNFTSNRKFRDTNGWYHFVYAVDTTQATESNRIKIYINGVQETSWSVSTYPSQNTDLNFNNNIIHYIGRSGYSSGSNSYFDGYMSHVSFVDGQQLAPTVFGSTDSTSGIWKFKSPSGVTWGTNGFHLKMENSGAMGTDSSGQTNNFTVNGNLKQAVDTPSNVFCTVNPLARYSSNLNITNGNTTVDENGNSWQMASSTLGASTGKWYLEYKIQTAGYQNGYHKIGFISDQAFANNTGHIAESALDGGYAFYCQNGSLEVRTDDAVISGYSTSDLGVNLTAGSVMCLAIDMDNKRAYFRKNADAWIKSADPVNGTNGLDISADYTTGKAMIPAVAIYKGGAGSINFGNGLFGTTAITSAGSNGNGSLFEYDVPTGFYALNTKNLNTYG